MSIITYWDANHVVDEVISSAFTGTSISNTNLETFKEFTVDDPQPIERAETKNYFGNLLLNFKPRTSDAVNSGYYLRFTFTNEFYPYSNQAGLPLSCKINDVRQPCYYSLTPFTVTFEDIASKFTTGVNKINITTEYLDHNGIHYPDVQGRYLLEVEVTN